MRSSIHQPDRCGWSSTRAGSHAELCWLSLAMPACLPGTCRWEHVAWLGVPNGMVLHPDGKLVGCDIAKARHGTG